MGFSDKLSVADGVTVTLNCGICNSPATEHHVCAKKYLRNPRIVLVRSLAEPSSNDPNDLFLITVEKGGEEYTTTRATLNRDYEEL